MSNNIVTTPRATAHVAGFFVPATKIEVTRSAFGNADIVHVTTYAVDTPQDWGAISQKYMPTSFKVAIGMPTDGGMTSLGTAISGVLDEIELTAETNTIELRGRGVLSALLDKRTSTRVAMNQNVSAVIRTLIQEAGLTPQVADSSINVGHLINEENVAMNRNLRLLDFINALTFGLGWKLRTNGNTVIVGPPPSKDEVYVLTKQWGAKAGTRLRVTHSALHAHDVHVKVISYIPHSKSIITARNELSALAESLGLVPAVSKSSKSKGTGGGRQSGTDASPSENPNTEEYVFHYPGKTQAECDQIANNIAVSIARKEFKMELVFSPTPDELRELLKAGTEFLIDLVGCPMASNDGLYYPETINYVYDVEGGGLKVTINATNHLLPVPTGGLPNAGA